VGEVAGISRASSNLNARRLGSTRSTPRASRSPHAIFMTCDVTRGSAGGAIREGGRASLCAVGILMVPSTGRARADARQSAGKAAEGSLREIAAEFFAACGAVDQRRWQSMFLAALPLCVTH
jgi:hypothetical protein